MVAAKLHPAYAARAAALGLLLDADSPEYLCWIVGMLMGWRAMPKASGRVWPSPGEPMDHQDHRHFAAWMEQAS